MKTKQIREEDFRDDLAALLKKHGAEIQITDDGKPYGMAIGIVIVTMRTRYDANDETEAEFTEFRL